MVELKPASVFEAFSEINKVPRPSKREDKMMEYLLGVGRELGLETQRDEVGNVVIRKPATPGMEDKPILVLQSHMDMVCEKNNDKEFDFDNDAIQAYVDGEWLTADGTTLGADDGIGCAMEIALLRSTDIEHGPLECVFTRDEETGLTGAEQMSGDFINGRMMVNLDNEEEGYIFVSCAGGCRTTATFHYTEEKGEGLFPVRLTIKGLTGGHSGDDINKMRANANKQLARFLYMEMEKTDLRLIDIQAGGLHNAIPREASCVVAVPFAFKEQIRIDWNIFQSEVENEFSVTEKSMEFLLESEIDTPLTLVDANTSRNLILALQGVYNGVFANCQDIDLVETSTNLASIRLDRETHTINVNSSQRSSILSARNNVAATFRAVFQLAGAEVETGEGYPGWAMNPNSRLLVVAVDEYKRLFGKEPFVGGIHAGLECGLFSEKFPGMDMISVGPTMRGVHSPDERMLIPTVQLVWDHLLAILKAI